MGINQLNTLYRQVILDHATNPRNRRKIESYTHQMELLNPTCGDAIVVQCVVVNSQIEDIAFNGEGCSISIASASMMTEVLRGKTLEQAMLLIQYFNQLVGGVEQCDIPQLDDELKDATFLSGVSQFPARYKCATLAWKAVEMVIEQLEKETNNE